MVVAVGRVRYGCIILYASHSIYSTGNMTKNSLHLSTSYGSFMILIKACYNLEMTKTKSCHCIKKDTEIIIFFSLIDKKLLNVKEGVSQIFVHFKFDKPTTYLH